MAARQLAAARGDSLSENARNLALISIATNDALIASFKTKYFYNFWRPFTAIRSGRKQTATARPRRTTAWITFLTTPCFPSYPSNHASGSNAAMETLRRIYGAAGHAITLTFTIPVIGATTLQYTQLTGHQRRRRRRPDPWRDALPFRSGGGRQVGREVATYVYKNNLQPIHP